MGTRGRARDPAAREQGPGARPPTSPGRRGLRHRAEGRRVGRPGRAGREGRHQGRGPDVRRRGDAACVRDSEYVTGPRALMPAAPPRPSPEAPAPQTPLSRGSHRRAGAKGDGGSPACRHSLGGVGAPTPTPPQLPETSPPLPVPGARSPTPPSEARARVTARWANGEAARRRWA